MPKRLLSIALFLPTLLLLTGCEDQQGGAAVADAPKTADALKALEGGTPLPEGAFSAQFPWMGKQSIMCVGDSVERQIAFVDFGTEQNAANGSPLLGSVKVGTDGSASGSFELQAKQLRTGHFDRDAKLLGGTWLDAEKHPTLKLTVKGMKRVRPTVWSVDATWTMRGVTQPVSFHVNARHVPEMKYVGKDLVRIKGTFITQLNDHEMMHPGIGSPAIAAAWQVDVVLLGKIQR